MRFTTKELALIILFSSLGAVISVPVGYLGDFLKTIPFLPLGTGQILSGIHISSLALAVLFIKKQGVGTMTGAVKGMVEAVLFSFHGFPVILMSIIQGLCIDTLVYLWRKRDSALYLGCGLASLSNVAYLQFFIQLPFPASVFSLMYLLSIISGVLFGGYGGLLLYKLVGTRISLLELE